MRIEMVDAWLQPGGRPDKDRIMIATLRDGVPWLHTMPPDTLETRAAEYDIEPTDVDTLLDLVLAENLLTTDQAHPDFLFNAPTRAHARDAHLVRCRAAVEVAQATTKRVNALGKIEARAAGEPTPREKVKALIVIDPDVVREKAKIVERQREQKRPKPPRKDFILATDAKELAARQPKRVDRIMALRRMQEATNGKKAGE